MVSIILNGALGFGMLLALLFSMSADVKGTINSNPDYPFVGMYQYAVGSAAGASAMVSLTGFFF